MEAYIKHHGVDGQKWGKRNGPPYPLDPNPSKQAQRKAESRAAKKEEKKNKKEFKKYQKFEKSKMYKNGYSFDEWKRVNGDATVGTAIGGMDVGILTGLPAAIAIEKQHKIDLENGKIKIPDTTTKMTYDTFVKEILHKETKETKKENINKNIETPKDTKSLMDLAKNKGLYDGLFLESIQNKEVQLLPEQIESMGIKKTYAQLKNEQLKTYQKWLEAESWEEKQKVVDSLKDI